LHVHPIRAATASAGGVRFVTEFPTTGRYRLFLQFKHDGRVHTAAFTANVAQRSHRAFADPSHRIG
jgi:hypothetical protein